MSRMEQLLAAAAEAFEDGRDPFETSWLVEHRVSLGECIDLGTQIASCIRAYLRLPAEGRALMLLASVAEDGQPLTADHLMDAVAARRQQRRLTEVLDELKRA